MAELTEHIKLLEKEITQLKLNFDRALRKPGCKAKELDDLEKKIELKTETLNVLIKFSESEPTYSVFWKMRQSEYEQNPTWRNEYPWFTDKSSAYAVVNMLMENPKCDVAKIVQKTEIYTDLVEIV
jgi:hypothetical protein